MASSSDETLPDKQCRICLDGLDPTLGRLIRPCLCKGSISYVHVKCLQQWRTTSASRTAFWACPQCHYRYHFSRTRVVGLATNPIVVALVSTVFFTFLVLLSSFLTTTFLSFLERGSSDAHYTLSYSPYYLNPIDVFRDLVASTLSILNDELGIIDETTVSPARASHLVEVISKPSGLTARLLKRFLLGLPLIGMGSLVQMIISLPFLGPVQWLARLRRGGRSRRDSGRDTTGIIILVLLLVGAARALIKVYDLTQRLAKRVLLRAEDIILEVS